jgi:RNA-directed DNA polymerase
MPNSDGQHEDLTNYKYMITTQIDQWEDLPHEKYEREVFQLQRRIFGLSQKGNRKQMHDLQKLLLTSFAARCVAVRKVAEENAGRNTAGVDGIKGLTDPQKKRLARSLDYRQDIAPVRRLRIPKPGKAKTRPLGIPTMKDRAAQALIALALEPEWEARFTPGMYGFRRGHSAHDAISIIRSCIQFSPKWVLDADIEKFFDRVDHKALLAKVNTFPKLEQALRGVLQSGSVEGGVISATNEGTPQGGPLSPLLANIVLCGLEDDLKQHLESMARGQGGRMPVMVLYADDFVVLHKDYDTVACCREYISAWLSKMGLNLHPGKTRITHTLDVKEGSPGFAFLGHGIQQFHTGKYAVKQSLKQITTNIVPSKEAQKRVYERIAGVIDKMLGGRSISHTDYAAVRRTIQRLNKIIRGWSAYFSRCNAKKTFSRLDSLVWWKIWRVMRRRYKKKGRTWTVQKFLKNSEGKWRLGCHGQQEEKEKMQMRLFAETPIQKHMQLRKVRSYFNGDWPYWGTRLGHYPSIPDEWARLLKRQRGRCHRCKDCFTRQDELIVQTEWVETEEKRRPVSRLVHHQCDSNHATL